MTGKTHELYELVIDRILLVLRQAGLRKPRIRLMVSDFELAILNTLRSRFRSGRPRGCYSHYCQVLYFFILTLKSNNC